MKIMKNLLLLPSIIGLFCPMTTLAFLTTTRPSSSIASVINNKNNRFSSSLYSSKEKEESSSSATKKGDDFIVNFFQSSVSEINDVMIPPSLNKILQSISQLASGSDIRGKFVDHPRIGNTALLGHSIKKNAGGTGTVAALTPFAAHCLGHAFAMMILNEKQLLEKAGKDNNDDDEEEEEVITICMGRDPRPHGCILADSFSRGAVTASPNNIRVVYTGIATTPAMFEFCRSSLCDAGVMVTASHLPQDKNGLKFFTTKGGFTKGQISELIDIAKRYAQKVYDQGTIPATSGSDGVFCSDWVDWMPHYESSLKTRLIELVGQQQGSNAEKETLKDLKIVLNSGNGSGGFFQKVLESLGADVSGSINVEHDSTFPNGVPNPENLDMVDTTIAACEAANADLGIMLDTDADRCGTIVPRKIHDDGTKSDYEPLGRNRLIALMGVIFAKESPGCAIVTDSVTSEGLATFLQDHLGLKHVRYLKGYANVINKAKSLTSNNVCNAEVAIETSGHCALKENDYLDDGTYAAVRIIGLLAQTKSIDKTKSLLDLIVDLPEMEEEAELRMPLKDESLQSTYEMFDLLSSEIETNCQVKNTKWVLDTDNLEGIRVSTGEGGFFMLRKSLHDPLLSLQVEAVNKEAAKKDVIEPLLQIFKQQPEVTKLLDFSSIQEYNE